MATSDVTAVGTAFEMLLEAIEGVVDDVNETGSNAFKQGRHDAARKVLEQADVLMGFRRKITTLRDEWASIYSEQEDEVKEAVGRRNLGRIPRGVKTPEKAYYVPILRTLVEMGGSAKTADVCDAVYRKMKRILKPIDMEPLNSEPHDPRWRNTAQWARNELREQGLIAGDSPFGVWEITDAGREFLERNG
ncbi:MAG: winged helix-turn-helix domain-containing protein [Armatimonadetes bacterium]|nr:winged helix-turn-helix domain-containing protein [Armatimonadota bacterium]